jgi:hypothetical protein
MGMIESIPETIKRIKECAEIYQPTVDFSPSIRWDDKELEMILCNLAVRCVHLGEKTGRE